MTKFCAEHIRLQDEVQEGWCFLNGNRVIGDLVIGTLESYFAPALKVYILRFPFLHTLSSLQNQDFQVVIYIARNL